MGKVKKFLLETQEQSWDALDNEEQAHAQYEKEFNDWLDFFETKYGLNNGGYDD